MKQFGGMLVALAMGSMPIAASAYEITIDDVQDQSSGTPVTSSNFAPLDLGTGTANMFQSNSTILNPGDGITSIMFGGTGSNPESGLYAGSVGGQFSSPYGTGAYPTTNYLVAGGMSGGEGGLVTVNFSAPQTALYIMWGTVDNDPENDLTTINVGGETISGSDILAAAMAQHCPGCGSGLTTGDDDMMVEITGLASFTAVNFTDNSNPAFEFDLGVPTPEPMSLAILGIGIAGLGMIRRRRV